MLYDTIEDATRRLERTVVHVAGIPSFIKEFTGEGKIECINLLNGEEFTFDYKKFSGKIDITPVKLGYCNLRGKAVYLMRLPTRKWKQGFGADNLFVATGNAGRDILQDRALGRTITGKYPSFEKTIQELKKDNVQSMAFSRSFAVQKYDEEIILMYRSSWVGDFKGDTITFKKQFIHLDSYLREVIKDDRIRII